MGIYIKNMEMPKMGCIKMVVICADGGHVIETTPGCDPPVGKQNYTAIEVPKHGDLIDRDAINWEDEIWKKKCISPYVVYNTWVIAKELPVVIESEGE